MAAACKISRDSNKEIQEVYAPNNKPSLLWHELVKDLGDKELALTNYVKTLDPNFVTKITKHPNKQRDVNGEISLKDFYEIDNLQPRKKPTSNSGDDETTFGSTVAIDEFTKQSANISVDESNPDKSFYTNGKREFKRLTEWVHNQFIKDKKYKDEYFDNLTKQEFIKRNTDIAEKIIYGKSIELKTFDEVRNEIRESVEKYKWIGKIIHKMIEGYLKHDDVNHFENEISDFAMKGNIEESEYAWFDKNKAEDLVEKLDINTSNMNNDDINFRDNIASELMMVNEKLGLGTANDGLVEHSDGSVSFIDYKTGVRFLDDAYTLNLMSYNDGLPTKIVKSKVNKAMLELTVRMIMAKMNKPDLAVRRLQIAHMSKKQRISIKSVPVQTFLDYINNNMKISIRELEKVVKSKLSTPEDVANLAELKEQYKGMLDANVFNFDNYRAESKELAEDQFDLSDQEGVTGKIQKLAKDSSRVVNKEVSENPKQNTSFSKPIQKIGTQIITLLNYYKTAKQDDLSESLENENIKDITFFDKHLKGIRQQSNQFLQRFGAYYDTMHDKAIKAMDKTVGEQSELQKKNTELTKEWKQRTGKTVIKIFSYTKDNNPVDIKDQGIFDFMYQFKTIGDQVTRLGAVYTEEDFKSGKLTQAQWEYYKTVKELLKDRYETIRTKIAYLDTKNNPVTYGQYYKNHGYTFDKFEESFLPTIPFTNKEEIIEKNIQQGSFNAKALWEEVWQNHTDRYDLSVQNEQKDKLGLPIKYMSNPFFIDDNHSFNVTAAVEAFSRHMTEKEYMDDVYNVGLGTVSIMSQDPDKRGQPKLQNSIDYLQSFLDQHLLGRMRVTTKYGKDDKVNKKIDNTVDNFGAFISMNAFWFNPVVAAWNYLFGQFTNAKEGIIGSMSKRIFGFDNEVTVSSITRANKVWWGHEVDQLTKRSNLKRQFDTKFETLYYEDKVNFMMKEFRLNNKSYKFVDHSIMKAVHNRLFSTDSAMVFEGLSEDASNEVLVIAAMISKKVEVKKVENGVPIDYYLKKDGTLTKDKTDPGLQNMWDAYEWNDTSKAYEYNGEYTHQNEKSKTRFLDNFGQEVTGMNLQESLQIKTYLERMYGAYSPEQKNSLERYALGRAVLKFKKFQIMNISENIGLNSDYNQNVGSYKALFNPDGTPKLKDGQQLYQWEAEIVRSRMVVLISLVKNIATLKKTAFSELTDEDKRQLSRMTFQLAFYLLLFTSVMGAIPPEDKDKQYAKRINRLIHDMIQIHPTELLGNLTTLDNYATFSTDAIKNGGNLILSLASGERMTSGTYKGMYKGQHWITTHIPIVSVPIKVKDMFNVKDDEKVDTKSMDSRITR